jgi:hypothetical protein
MSLQDTLNQMKAEFEAKAPKDALEIMHRATEDLRNSGIMNTFLKKGDQAPEFLLPDHTGTQVSSSDLLENGSLVVSFYRGVW